MLTRVDLTMDATDAQRLADFWKVAVGYEDVPPPAPFTTREEWVASFGDPEDQGREDAGGAWLFDPAGIAPRLAILEVPEPKITKNRLHLDLRVTGDLTGAEKWPAVLTEVERLRAAGGNVVDVVEGHHVVMADPEGNEFCVA